MQPRARGVHVVGVKRLVEVEVHAVVRRKRLPDCVVLGVVQHLWRREVEHERALRLSTAKRKSVCCSKSTGAHMMLVRVTTPVCVRACVCVCVRACVRVCVCACVCLSVSVSLYLCLSVSVSLFSLPPHTHTHVYARLHKLNLLGSCEGEQ